MNYQPKIKDLVNIANFFCEKYNYMIENMSERIEGMGCATIVLVNKDLPKIKIDMERYLLNFQLFLNERYIPLLSIYKFYHPKEILKDCSAYRKKKIFKQSYIKDNNRYLNDFLSKDNVFNLSEYENFYKLYPFYVWKWN